MTQKHGKCCGQKAKSEFLCSFTVGNVTLRGGKSFPRQLGELLDSRDMEGSRSPKFMENLELPGASSCLAHYSRHLCQSLPYLYIFGVTKGERIH